MDKVELLETFRSFLKQGIAHILANGDIGKASPMDRTSVVLPAGAVEKMRDILLDVDQLAGMLDTGMRDVAETYSSSVEDYTALP